VTLERFDAPADPPALRGYVAAMAQELADLARRGGDELTARLLELAAGTAEEKARLS
jgi:hypothetical protein